MTEDKKFSDFQKYKCAEIELEDIGIELPKFCPSCEKDPSFVGPTWYSSPEPYLDKKNCLYKVNITAIIKDLRLQIDEDELSTYSITYGNHQETDRDYFNNPEVQSQIIRTAIYQLLINYDKEVKFKHICNTLDCSPLRVKKRLKPEVLEKLEEIVDALKFLKKSITQDIADGDSIVFEQDDINSYFEYSFDLDEGETLSPILTATIEEYNNLLDERKRILDGLNIPIENFNAYGLENFATIEDTYYPAAPTAGTTIQFLVSVPAFVLDRVPSASQAGDDEDDEGRDDFVVRAPRLRRQLKVLSSAMYLYTLQYAVARRLDGTAMYYEGTGLKEYDFELVSKSLKTFPADGKLDLGDTGNDVFFKLLKEALKFNNFRIDNFQLGAMFNKLAQQIKFKVKSDANKPFQIKNIFVETKECRYKKLKGGPARKLIRYLNKHRFVSKFLSEIDEIENNLTAANTPEWHNFIPKYAYPDVVVQQANDKDGLALSDDRIALECLLEDAGISAIGSGQIRNYLLEKVVPLSKLLAFVFNQRACFQTEDLDENNPTNVKFNQIFGADSYRDNQDRFYQQEVDKIIGGESSVKVSGQTYNASQDISDENQPSTLRDYALAISSKTGEDYNSVLVELEYQATLRAATRVENEVTEAETQGGNIANFLGIGGAPGNFFTGEDGHPMAIEAAELAKQKFKFEDSFLSDLLDFKRGSLGLFKNNKDKFGPADLFSFFGICGYRSLIAGVIECLLGGLSFEQFVAKFIESTLKNLTVEQLGLFVDGLPPEEQAKVYAEVQKALGTLVKPWEAGGGFTTNTISTVTAGQPLVFDQERSDLDELVTEEVPSPPSELAEWNSLSGPERQQAIQTYGQPKVDVTDPNFTGDYEQSTVGNALNNVAATFVRAYTNALINTLDIDILLDKVKDYPGAQLLKKVLFQFACMTPPLTHPPIADFLKSFSLQVCNPQVAITRPRLTSFNINISWKIIIDKLKDAINDALEDIYKGILWNILLKVLELIDGLLCRALAGVGKFVGSALQDAVTGDGSAMSFHTAMREAFCGPETTPEKVNQISDSILAGLGYIPNDFNIADVDPQFTSNTDASASQVAAAIISGTFTKEDMLYHFAADPDDYDTTLLRTASRAIAATNPQMGAILGSPDQMANFFASISNFLSPDQRQQILDSLENPQIENPVNESLCLTNEQYDDWVDRRERLFEFYGLPEGIPAAQDEQLGDDLSDLLDAYNNPTGAITEGIANLLKESICEDGEGVIPRDSAETRELANKTSDDIFNNLKMAIYRDLLGNKGYLNELLTDTEGKSLRRHRFRTFFSRRYVNDEEEETKRRSKGYFPETVGLYLKEQIENIDPTFEIRSGEKTLEPRIESSVKKKFEIFRSSKNMDTDQPDQNPDRFGDLGRKRINVTIPAKKIKRPNTSISFTDGLENPYKFTITYGDKRRNNPENEMWSELSIKTRLGESDGDATIYRSRGYIPQTLINDYAGQVPSTKNPRLEYFKAFMNSKISAGTTEPVNFGPEIKNIYENLNKLFLENISSDVVKDPVEGDISSGFQFGYKAETLEPEDLEYVDPEEGATEYTYRNSEAVLGRSKTNNPRVTFLDPELYGGRYTNPPYIIEPAQHSGWYGFSQKLIPSHKFCDSKEVDIIGFKYIKNQVNFYYNNIPTDERLQQEEECVVEPPFGKIADRTTKSNLHGLVTAIIRMYLAQTYMNGLPVFANVSFNSKNFSNIIYQFVNDILESDLTDTPDRDLIIIRTKIMKENYFLLFLEQVVESYQRLIDYKGVQPPKNVADALNTIRKVQAFYNQPDFSDIDKLRGFDQFTPEEDVLRGLGPEFKLNVSPNEYELITDKKYLKFFKHALAYQTFGEAIFFSDNDVELIRLRKTDRYLKYFRMVSKIFCVRLVKKQAMEILTEFAKYESDKLFKVLDRKVKPSPPINSIIPFMLQNENLCLLPEHKYGLTKPLQELRINGEADFGKVHDVQASLDGNILSLIADVDQEQISSTSVGGAAAAGAAVAGPVGGAVAGGAAAYSNAQQRQEAEAATQAKIDKINANGIFILQRYIKVDDKEEVVPAVADRNENLFGVVRMDKFQEYLETLDQDKKISDYFGNLEFVYSLSVQELVAKGLTLRGLKELGLSKDIDVLGPEIMEQRLQITEEMVDFNLEDLEPSGIVGKTGLSYGLRLCYYPPASMPLQNLSVSRDTAVKSKAFDLKPVPEFPNGSFMIPLVEVEVEMIDQQLSDVDFFEGPNAFDLYCMFRDLEEKDEYKFLFNDAIPIPTYMGMLALYSNMGFQASWGLGDDERVDPPEENEEEDDDEELDLDGDGEEFDFDFYEKSRKTARRLFANFYDQNDFIDNESAGDDDIFKFMLNFNPFRFRLPFRIKWWKRRRRRDYRCEDDQ
jgi:hypothetical protein